MDKLGQVRAVLVLTLCLNLLVSLTKLVTGYLVGAVSMVADGFHSLFDASSNIIGLFGVKVAAAPPDKAHPYGHRKYETFAALGVAGLLFLTCVEILRDALSRLFDGRGAPEATLAGFAVMFFSVAVNLFVYRYEAGKGRELSSDFLLADAGHSKSDIFASGSVIASLTASRLGFPLLDPLAAVVIAALIARVGYGIIRSSIDILADAARIREEEIVAVCMGVPGVRRCHRVRSRGRDDAVYMDLRIHVDPELSTAESHAIAHRVEAAIRAGFAGIKDVVVHVEPGA